MDRMEIVIAVLLGLLVAAAAGFGWALLRRFRAPSASDPLAGEVRELAGRLAAFSQQVTGQLGAISGQVIAHEGELARKAEHTARLFGDLSRQLGELRESSRRITDVGRDITELHRIFVAPKLRGGLGESLLAELLAEALPGGCYELQYGFRGGARVDAVIRLGGRLVPVDAKFPLENFRRVVEGGPDAERRRAAKRFAADCRRHIDAIASSYILPDESTTNFALMYIPAENVYHEAFLRETSGDGQTLAEYALSRRVVPVSPTSFYAYLQTIVMGLRGMEISERAEEMLHHIERLRGDFRLFTDDFETLGRHVTNAKARYDEARLRAERVSARLSGLASSSPAASPEAPAATAAPSSPSPPGPED
ncbi:MAG: DNA recombination protein RmuC [Thermodesulfobacteriota bacterium]